MEYYPSFSKCCQSYRIYLFLLLFFLLHLIFFSSYYLKTIHPKKNFHLDVLDGVFVKDVFRIRDNALMVFFIKDFRNLVKIQAKIGDSYVFLDYHCVQGHCDHPRSQDHCTHINYYAEIPLGSYNISSVVYLRLKGNEQKHEFKIIDVRNNGTYGHELGVVLQATFFLADWQNLIQFFESWLFHGCTKFYVYHYSWTRQVADVIQFYQEKLGNGLEIIPWSPILTNKVDIGDFKKDNNARLYNLMGEASLNNGFYRSKGSVKFLALMDLDEIMFVEGGQKLLPFLHELLEESPNAAQFAVAWPHVATEISLVGLRRPSDISFDYLKSVKTVKKGSIDNIYYFFRKLFHLTSRVELVDIHWSWRTFNNKSDLPFERVDVDKRRASCFHMRRIFTVAAHKTYAEESRLVGDGKQMTDNFRKRIQGTKFANIQMAPWHQLYRQTLTTLNECRRITRTKTNQVAKGGLDQCYSIRGCEEFLGNKNYFIFAEPTWTDLAA